MSSSYSGWGLGSLDRDADEIQLLLQYLTAEHNSAGLVLMGHSTGCQDTVRVMQKRQQGAGQQQQQGAAAAPPPPVVPLLGTILQASTSDREWLGQYPELADVAAKARAMVAEGRGEEVVVRLARVCDHPVTARRFCSLYDKGGDDDMFSGDLTDEELKALLSPVGSLPCLVLYSGQDETVPAHRQPHVIEHAARLAKAISNGGQEAQCVVVDGAPHNLKGKEAQGVAAVMQFITCLPGTE